MSVDFLSLQNLTAFLITDQIASRSNCRKLSYVMFRQIRTILRSSLLKLKMRDRQHLGQFETSIAGDSVTQLLSQRALFLIIWQLEQVEAR